MDEHANGCVGLFWYRADSIAPPLPSLQRPYRFPELESLVKEFCSKGASVSGHSCVCVEVEVGGGVSHAQAAAACRSQVVFVPTLEELAADPDDKWQFCIRATDHLYPVCHEGINRSQVQRVPK